MPGNNNRPYRERQLAVWEEDYRPEASLSSLRALRASAKQPFSQMAKGKLPTNAGNRIMTYLTGKEPMVLYHMDPTMRMEETYKFQQQLESKKEMEKYRQELHRQKMERQSVVTKDPQGALSGNYGYEIQQEAQAMGIKKPELPPLTEEEMMEMFVGPNWREKEAKKAAKKAAKGTRGARKSRRGRKTRRN